VVTGSKTGRTGEKGQEKTDVEGLKTAIWAQACHKIRENRISKTPRFN
jgi:hypothetical protein